MLPPVTMITAYQWAVIEEVSLRVFGDNHGRQLWFARTLENRILVVGLLLRSKDPVVGKLI